MGRLRVKDGVDFGTCFGFAGARILSVAKYLVLTYPFDITITSSRDGIHSSPSDPHYEGNAFDFRTRDLTIAQCSLFLNNLRLALGTRFYAFLEAPGTVNEHIHCQRCAGTVYTALDFLANA